MLLDIVLVVILVGGIFLGLKKGMAKLLTSLVGFVLSIVLAYLFSTTLANVLYKEVGWGPKISKSVQTNIKAYVKNSKANANKEYMINIDSFMTSQEKSIIDLNGKQTPSTIKVVSEKITRYILKGIAFVMILVVVSICASILGMVLDGIFSLPILNIFNKLGGGAVSVILTILKVWIALGIVSLIAPLGAGEMLVGVINKSTFVKMLYENNWLMSIVIKKYLN